MKRTNHISAIVFIAITTLFIHTAARDANAEQLSNFTGKWSCTGTADYTADFAKYQFDIKVEPGWSTEVAFTFIQKSEGEFIPRTITNNGEAKIDGAGRFLYGYGLVVENPDPTTGYIIEWVYWCNGQLKHTKYGYLEMTCIGYGSPNSASVTDEDFRCSAQCKRQNQHID